MHLLEGKGLASDQRAICLAALFRDTGLRERWPLDIVVNARFNEMPKVN